MEQPILKNSIDLLLQATDSVAGTPRAAGQYFIREIHNKRLGMSALVFTNTDAPVTSTDQIPALVIFHINKKWPRLAEVKAAWVDPGFPGLPFSSTVVAYCTSIYKTWSVPFSNVFEVSPFALVPFKQAHLYDQTTGRLILDWELTPTGVVTHDGGYHLEKTVVAITGENQVPPPALQAISTSATTNLKIQ